MNNKLLKQPAVYIFTNKLNDKVYIGETVNLYERIRDYKYVKTDRPFGKALVKYGLDGFHFEYYYFPDFTKKDLLDMEEQMIVRYKSLTSQHGYNVCVRGKDTTGIIVSEETRKKLSDAKTGKPNNMLGRKHTDEARKNIADAMKARPNNMLGRKHTDEARKKISDVRIGKKASEETRNKMRESRNRYLLEKRSNV